MVTINLIPESVQAAQVRRRHLKRWVGCIIVTTGIAVVPVGAHWVKHLGIDELRATSDKLQTDLAAARAELKTATAAANDSFLRIERARALRTKRAWSNMLALIGSCLPKDCWLTSIATDPDVPTAAPTVRKTPPPSATPFGADPSPQHSRASGLTDLPVSAPGKGGQRGFEPEVVMIDTPRKLRLIGEATDATQPLSFVTKLKESLVFRDVVLERSINISSQGSRALGQRGERGREV